MLLSSPPSLDHLISQEFGIRNIYNSLNINSEDVVDLIEFKKFTGLSCRNLLTHFQVLAYYDLVFKKYSPVIM